MRFSKATDYGLLLVIHLAKLDEGERTSVRSVASTCNISERFLANIVAQLSTAGIVCSRRGAGGGIWLARPSEDISLRDVIEVLEGPLELFDCQRIPSLCQQEDACTMKRFWNEVRDGLMSTLGHAKLCDFANADHLSDVALGSSPPSLTPLTT